MQLRNTTERWGAGAKCLHWTLALAIFVMMVLGWIMTAWPKSPAKFEMYFVHKSLGIVILALMVLRLCWRLLNPTPRLPKTLKPYERVLAHGTHALLYLLLLAMPVSGWASPAAIDADWLRLSLAGGERLRTHPRLPQLERTLADAHCAGTRSLLTGLRDLGDLALAADLGFTAVAGPLFDAAAFTRWDARPAERAARVA